MISANLEECSLTINNQVKIYVVQTLMTLENVDAIVNAANSYTMGGKGEPDAIAKKGGPLIRYESKSYIQKHG